MIFVLVQHIWHVWMNDFTALRKKRLFLDHKGGYATLGFLRIMIAHYRNPRISINEPGWMSSWMSRSNDFTKTLHVWPQSDFGVVLNHYSLMFFVLTIWCRVCLWAEVWPNNIGGCQKLNPNDLERGFLPSVWNQTKSMTPQEVVLMHQSNKTCYIANLQHIYIYIALVLHITVAMRPAKQHQIPFFVRSNHRPRPVTRKPVSRKSMWWQERGWSVTGVMKWRETIHEKMERKLLTKIFVFSSKVATFSEYWNRLCFVHSYTSSRNCEIGFPCIIHRPGCLIKKLPCSTSRLLWTKSAAVLQWVLRPNRDVGWMLSIPIGWILEMYTPVI